MPTPAEQPWSSESWRGRPAAQEVSYPDPAALESAVSKLRSMPPLVTSWEIERLRGLIADAQAGRRFLLQGGDCAETLDECRPELLTSKLKILLQMSLVLVHGSKRPVVRVGRFAGQYAKPRSSPTETRRDGGKDVTLPSYFGDLVNRAEFTPEARRPDPRLLVEAYEHAAVSLNFVRSLVEGGFADLHHPEYWDLSFFNHANLSASRRTEYEKLSATLADGLRFMEALGERSVEDLSRVEFFTSHEALNLHYESALTRAVPRREGAYNLSTHLPWLGERTRGPGGAHVEYLRGIRNPVGVKLGPGATADELRVLSRVLNPGNEPGKLLLITRFGAEHVGRALPGLVRAVTGEGLPVLWVCDPMHGNGIKTAGGIKTRSFDAILSELEQTYDLLEAEGARLGGVHFELTGEDVTECVGGASGVTEESLSSRYNTACDPRLNYAQSLELAFLLAGRMSRTRASGRGESRAGA